MLGKQPAAKKDKKASLVAVTPGTERSHGEFIVCEPESGATMRSEVVTNSIFFTFTSLSDSYRAYTGGICNRTVQFFGPKHPEVRGNEKVRRKKTKV